MPSFTERLQHAWNAFTNKDEYWHKDPYEWGMGYSYRPDRPRLSKGHERSIVTSIYNRLATDVAAISIEHVRLDENDRYVEEIDSTLNNCLKVEANRDQTGRALIQDIAMSMFDEGCVAVVPTDTSINPKNTGSYDILELRTGKILEWKPYQIKVNVYNENKGVREDLWIFKDKVAIIENPFYSVMNEPNSTLQRLIRKLVLLDAVDEQSSSGKLDMIIQLPYTIKTPMRMEQAERRRKQIEQQLTNTKYGIAYVDATEKITQLNRSIENNLLSQIEYLTSMLYGQLGLSQTIFDGTADEKTMINYYNRTIEPILSAITDELSRKFLTKTARTQNQAIMFFRDPFKLLSMNEIAGIADTFTRNEITTSNEIRAVMGMKPSQDPRADELRNKNLYPEDGNISSNENVEEIQNGNESLEEANPEQMTTEEIINMIEQLDAYDDELDELEDELNNA